MHGSKILIAHCKMQLAQNGINTGVIKHKLAEPIHTKALPTACVRPNRATSADVACHKALLCDFCLTHISNSGTRAIWQDIFFEAPFDSLFEWVQIRPIQWDPIWSTEHDCIRYDTTSLRLNRSSLSVPFSVSVCARSCVCVCDAFFFFLLFFFYRMKDVIDIFCSF